MGGALGRSSPYLDLASGIVDVHDNSSVLVRGGPQVAGRVEAPLAGAWRARLEGVAANWQVVQQTYGSQGQVSATRSEGHVEAHQISAMIGRQGGRDPACGYVLAGGGIYSLRYRGARLVRPGLALTAGIEVPVGRGTIQAEMQLHMIDTRGRDPVAGSAALAASISAGYTHRF